MKHFITLVCLIYASFAVAQQHNMQQVLVETESFASKYEFDDNQKLELKKIIEKKYIELNNIESLRKQDAKLYSQKRRALYKNMDASIDELMTPEQKKMYVKKQKEGKEKSKNLKKKSSNYKKAKLKAAKKTKFDN